MFPGLVCSEELLRTGEGLTTGCIAVEGQRENQEAEQGWGWYGLRWGSPGTLCLESILLAG